MKNQIYDISIKDLHERFNTPAVEDLDEDFFISKVDSRENLEFFTRPCRFDGFFAFYCAGTPIEIEINQKNFDIKKGMFLVYIPGHVVKFSIPASSDDPKCYVIGASKTMIGSLQYNFAKLYEQSMVILENPCITINENERQVGRQYRVLVQSILASGLPSTKKSLLAIGSSFFYYMGSVWAEHTNESKAEEQVNDQKTRHNQVFENFMQLVHDNYATQHDMKFYASELCLTPKYLSKIIHNTSGKTGPEWISSYLILEAKNLLKYTHLDIKEIVYRLHFKSPAIFYRFFKANTGMTPAQYRNS